MTTTAPARTPGIRWENPEWAVSFVSRLPRGTALTLEDLHSAQADIPEYFRKTFVSGSVLPKAASLLLDICPSKTVRHIVGQTILPDGKLSRQRRRRRTRVTAPVGLESLAAQPGESAGDAPPAFVTDLRDIPVPPTHGSPDIPPTEVEEPVAPPPDRKLLLMYGVAALIEGQIQSIVDASPEEADPEWVLRQFIRKNLPTTNPASASAFLWGVKKKTVTIAVAGLSPRDLKEITGEIVGSGEFPDLVVTLEEIPKQALSSGVGIPAAAVAVFSGILAKNSNELHRLQQVQKCYKRVRDLATGGRTMTKDVIIDELRLLRAR